jgi:Peptidase family M41
MDIKNIHIELIARKQTLEQARCALKEKFIGLDEIIDEVMSSLVPWYIFPEAQLRPTIINLWGLTGSGKTALVQTLVELLTYRKLYCHIDMGEFESDSASWMKSILTDDLSFFHEKSPIICLDEFQFARTLDQDENELGKDKLRVVWDLLDSGKIQYIPNSGSYYLFRAENCLTRVEKLVREKVVLRDGIVVDGVEYFTKALEGFYFDYNDRSDALISPSYFVTDDFVNGMFHLFDDDDVSKEQLRTQIKNATTQELAALIRQGMHTRPPSRTLDLSHSLIFVVGNLDEAYSMSHNMNPDISADEFHEATAKITIADIKRALRKRFRPEQIARLGNNHIIYKSFNCAQFRVLIRQELRRIEVFVNNHFGWRLMFDESVVSIVYAEGVFPAQGTRPVFTTVKNLIESKVSNLAVSMLEYQLEPVLVNWKYDKGQFIYEVLDEKGYVVRSLFDQAKLKLDNLRMSVDPQIQAHTAVHEAGHAVLAALTLRIIPSVVVSRTASDMEGFCLVNFPKGPMTRESLKKDIVITLGGYVAEKIIFGEEYTSSGVYGDIEEASRLANKAVRNYAMGSDPICLAVGTQHEDAFIVSQKYAAEAVAIIKDCEKEAMRILQKNKLLLLKMADYLTTHSRMEEQMISDYIRQFSVESWIATKGFLKKDEYYQFNTLLQLQLLEQEQENIPSEIERMIAFGDTTI